MKELILLTMDIPYAWVIGAIVAFLMFIGYGFRRLEKAIERRGK